MYMNIIILLSKCRYVLLCLLWQYCICAYLLAITMPQVSITMSFTAKLKQNRYSGVKMTKHAYGQECVCRWIGSVQANVS